MEPSNPYQPPGPPGSIPVPPVMAPALAAEPGTRIDFNHVMRFFFEDPSWVRKLVVGGLFHFLSMAVVGIFFIAGYLMELVRRAAAGERHPLPEWDNLGEMFVEGAKAAAVYFLFIVPFVILFSVPGIAMGPMSEGGEPSPAMSLLLVVLMPIGLLAYLALLVFFPAAVVRMAMERRFSAAFEMAENFAFIRRNGTNFILALLFYVLATFLAQLGLLLFCIGIFPAAFWAVCVGAFAFGDVVRRDPQPML